MTDTPKTGIEYPEAEALAETAVILMDLMTSSNNPKIRDTWEQLVEEEGISEARRALIWFARQLEDVWHAASEERGTDPFGGRAWDLEVVPAVVTELADRWPKWWHAGSLEIKMTKAIDMMQYQPVEAEELDGAFVHYANSWWQAQYDKDQRDLTLRDQKGTRTARIKQIARRIGTDDQYLEIATDKKIQVYRKPEQAIVLLYALRDARDIEHAGIGCGLLEIPVPLAEQAVQLAETLNSQPNLRRISLRGSRMSLPNQQTVDAPLCIDFHRGEIKIIPDDIWDLVIDDYRLPVLAEAYYDLSALIPSP